MKRNQWLTPKGITSIVLMIGVLAGTIVVTATYITLPKDVEAMQEDLIDLKQIIQAQQTINEFYYQREQQPYQNQRQLPPNYPPIKEPYCEWEDGKEWCWDTEYEEWWRKT